MDAAVVTLGKRLRSLASLPLKVISLQPISPEYRHTSPFSPLPHPFAGGPRARNASVARCLQPLEAPLQIESSGQNLGEHEIFQLSFLWILSRK